jgi:RHS repeat-associated protein
MVDPSGTTTYTYDNRDRVSSKATPEGTLTYTYDGASNVTSVISSNPNGTNVGYSWDADNRLATVTDNRTMGATNYTYDETNQIKTITYPNGVEHAYGYDLRDRLTNLTVTGPNGPIVSYTQGFSDSGRKKSVNESSGRTVNYGYDAIYRLLNENIAGNSVTAQNGMLTYGLDPVGNRLSLTSTLAALQSQAFTYDNNDRVSGNTFDNNGNTLSIGGVNYTYDFEDRLVSTSTGVQIVYDGDGNRVSETAGGVARQYLVDELNPTGYSQVAEELVAGSVTSQYTLGLNRISQLRSTTSYYAYDGFGSVRALSDTSGAVTDTYAYDAFGTSVAPMGTTINPYLYRGEQFDAALDMYYLRARYYVPRTGSFLTADSSEGDRELPITQNRFLYGNADPVLYSDPTGHGSVLGTALRSFMLRVAVVASRAEAVGATRLIGCAFAIGLLAVCSDTLMEHILWRKLPGANGINISTGIGVKMSNGWIEETKAVIGVYSKNPLSPAAVEALNGLRNETTEVVFSSSLHAERLVESTIQMRGMLVDALTTVWDMCKGSRQNCAAAFGTIAGTVVRGVGRCIYPFFPIVP